MGAATGRSRLREDLAEAIQVAYNGTLITWAIFRQGPLGAALRSQLEFILKPFRAR